MYYEHLKRLNWKTLVAKIDFFVLRMFLPISHAIEGYVSIRLLFSITSATILSDIPFFIVGRKQDLLYSLSFREMERDSSETGTFTDNLTPYDRIDEYGNTNDLFVNTKSFGRSNLKQLQRTVRSTSDSGKFSIPLMF